MIKFLKQFINSFSRCNEQLEISMALNDDLLAGLSALNSVVDSAVAVIASLRTQIANSDSLTPEQKSAVDSQFASITSKLQSSVSPS